MAKGGKTRGTELKGIWGETGRTGIVGLLLLAAVVDREKELEEHPLIDNQLLMMIVECGKVNVD
ncbi:MAG TPA: hypothetical protein VK203_01680 [Nostocaceae cyanobacterium]|nr:hypothetical protein [Nostocaceae cyanobacterium]